ncbi:hypothetical protein ABTW96_34125 [Nocardia beijingensis]|uniref:ATP dependent DNA ligase n=1 Tax=Nocardia beijingensis TaxID=95162 RepID=UPI0033268B0C
MVYLGHVGTGFTVPARRALLERLKALTTTDSPFDQSAPSWRMTAARWVRPQLAGTLEYREFVGALRHPSWRGLRAEMPVRRLHAGSVPTGRGAGHHAGPGAGARRHYRGRPRARQTRQRVTSKKGP